MRLRVIMFCGEESSGTLYLCNVVSFVISMVWWHVRIDSGGWSIRDKAPRNMLRIQNVQKRAEVVNWTAIRKFDFCRYYTASSGLQTTPWG
jgi:hypothetical protein